ncbi:unnamed protein product [Caenorhabditis nigoni]|uniref:Uncharacterized protein n=1 Tax=Caenorhabditis nigoni TaxID=1611254 RepID=A0A2G5SCU3_9PELO|nr:hypothetical protein B9Z55_028105 [Caenorhabditis nigoni]
MCSVYAHFLINVTLQDGNRTFEICNFLGEKIVRRVTRPDEVNATIFTTLKKRSSLPDDISLVSRSTIGYEAIRVHLQEQVQANRPSPQQEGPKSPNASRSTNNGFICHVL